MIDFTKFYCDQHPNDLITNFCHKQTCMIGLCATCICIHTQSHIINGTIPQYQNIRSTYSNLQDELQGKINSFEQQKSRITKINENIQKKKQIVKETIRQTKFQVLKSIHQFFENKQKQILRDIQVQQNKLGLHSETRMQSLMNNLTRQTQNLLTSAQQLNSQNFLESYQRIRCQILINAEKLQYDISEELDKNQRFEATLNRNDKHIQGMLRSLEQSLILGFKISRMENRSQNMNSSILTTNGHLNTGFSSENKANSFLNSRQEWMPKTLQSKIVENTSFTPAQNSKSRHISTMSFSQMPLVAKQQEQKLADPTNPRTTAKSILVTDDEDINLVTGSFFRKDSNPFSVKNVHQSIIFLQKDPNISLLPSQFPVMSSSFVHPKNNQSSLTIGSSGDQPMLQTKGWSPDTKNVRLVTNERSLTMSASQPRLGHSNSTTQMQAQRTMTHVHPQGTFNPIGFRFQGIPSSKGDEGLKKVRKTGLTLLKVNNLFKQNQDGDRTRQLNI